MHWRRSLSCGSICQEPRRTRLRRKHRWPGQHLSRHAAGVPKHEGRRGRLMESMAKRILIVEDHKENADAVADFVRFVFEDWTVEFATRGGQAVEQSLANPADVMVLDIALADEVNGLEVVKRLWE